MTYTLGEAAKATGLTKPTLSKAIKSGKISAVRNENGSYAIDPAELFRVYPATGQEANHTTPSVLQRENEILREQLARDRHQYQETVNDLRHRLDEAEAARREAATETRRLTLLLTHQPPVVNETPPARLSFWRRLTGQG